MIILNLGNILANGWKLSFRKHEKCTVCKISNLEFLKSDDTTRKNLQNCAKIYKEQSDLTYKKKVMAVETFRFVKQLAS